MALETQRWKFVHFYPINVSDSNGPYMEEWTTLTALAQGTIRILLGCIVMGIFNRLRYFLAREVTLM